LGNRSPKTGKANRPEGAAKNQHSQFVLTLPTNQAKESAQEKMRRKMKTTRCGKFKDAPRCVHEPREIKIGWHQQRMGGARRKKTEENYEGLPEVKQAKSQQALFLQRSIDCPESKGEGLSEKKEKGDFPQRKGCPFMPDTRKIKAPIRRSKETVGSLKKKKRTAWKKKGRKK